METITSDFKGMAKVSNILIFVLINNFLSISTNIFYHKDFTSALLLPVNLVEENYRNNIPQIPSTPSDTYCYRS